MEESSNPVSITIPAHNKGEATFLSNVAYNQYVEANVHGNLAIYKGMGVNTLLQTDSGSGSWEFGPWDEPRICEMTFLFDPEDESGVRRGYEVASVDSPVISVDGPLTTYTLTSRHKKEGNHIVTVVSVVCYDTSFGEDRAGPSA